MSTLLTVWFEIAPGMIGVTNRISKQNSE